MPDDDTREYAYPSKVEKMTSMCGKNGYHIISMKDDFLTIYGEGVSKNALKLDYTNSLIDLYNSGN